LTWKVTYADKFPEDSQGCSFQQYIGAQPFVDSRNGTFSVAAEGIRAHDRPCSVATVQFSQYVFKSTDGGQSFAPGVKIANVTPATPQGFLPLGPGKAMRIIEFPSLPRVGTTLSP